jgi:hypothetical protein
MKPRAVKFSFDLNIVLAALVVPVVDKDKSAPILGPPLFLRQSAAPPRTALRSFI